MTEVGYEHALNGCLIEWVPCVDAETALAGARRLVERIDTGVVRRPVETDEPNTWIFDGPAGRRVVRVVGA